MRRKSSPSHWCCHRWLFLPKKTCNKHLVAHFHRDQCRLHGSATRLAQSTAANCRCRRSRLNTQTSCKRTLLKRPIPSPSSFSKASRVTAVFTPWVLAPFDVKMVQPAKLSPTGMATMGVEASSERAYGWLPVGTVMRSRS